MHETFPATFEGGRYKGQDRIATLSPKPEKERGPRLGTRAPKTHSVSRPFFDRGVGSSILASLSEAGGNDRHKSWSEPLPPRSKPRADRHSECVHVPLLCRLVTIRNRIPPTLFSLFLLIFQRFAWHDLLRIIPWNPDSGARNPASGIAPVNTWTRSFCNSLEMSALWAAKQSRSPRIACCRC